MMKIVGAFLIVGTTSIWGMAKAERVKKQLENMKDLQKIISFLQSEIRYSKAFLGEIFDNLRQRIKEPYKSWFWDMSERTKSFSGESFGEIWKDSIGKHLRELELPKYELEALKSLGNQLGYADIQVQMKMIDLYQEHLERTIREVYDEARMKVRLYHCLGVMSGLFVAVLLF